MSTILFISDDTRQGGRVAWTDTGITITRRPLRDAAGRHIYRITGSDELTKPIRKKWFFEVLDMLAQHHPFTIAGHTVSWQVSSKRRKHITREQVQEMHDLFSQGYCCEDIAEYFDVSPPCVRHHIRPSDVDKWGEKATGRGKRSHRMKVAA